MPDRDPILDALAAISDRLARIERVLTARGAEHRLLSYRQAAKLLGVDRAKVARWVREGRLRAVQFDAGKRTFDNGRRIPMGEIERLELEGLPGLGQRPRRQRQKKAPPAANMTATEIATELEKY